MGIFGPPRFKEPVGARRNVGRINPDYVDELLTATGWATSRKNRFELQDRTMRSLIAAGAHKWFAMLQEPQRDRQLTRFIDSIPPERIEEACDLVIDWLFDWNPAMTVQIPSFLEFWNEAMKKPESFLRTLEGPELPSFYD